MAAGNGMGAMRKDGALAGTWRCVADKIKKPPRKTRLRDGDAHHLVTNKTVDSNRVLCFQKVVFNGNAGSAIREASQLGSYRVV